MGSLRDLNDNWYKWRKFAEGKTVIEVAIDEYDVYANATTYKNHREYVEELFRRKGYAVTRFGHTYRGDGSVAEWGLVFDRGDSDIRTLVQIKGIVGINIKPISVAVVS